MPSGSIGGEFVLADRLERAGGERARGAVVCWCRRAREDEDRRRPRAHDLLDRLEPDIPGSSMSIVTRSGSSRARSAIAASAVCQTPTTSISPPRSSVPVECRGEGPRVVADENSGVRRSALTCRRGARRCRAAPAGRTLLRPCRRPHRPRRRAWRSSSSPSDVTITTGSDAVLGSRADRPVSSRPSISGISRSVITRSISSSAARGRAPSRPSLAVSTR